MSKPHRRRSRGAIPPRDRLPHRYHSVRREQNLRRPRCVVHVLHSFGDPTPTGHSNDYSTSKEASNLPQIAANVNFCIRVVSRRTMQQRFHRAVPVPKIKIVRGSPADRPSVAVLRGDATVKKRRAPQRMKRPTETLRRVSSVRSRISPLSHGCLPRLPKWP